MPTILDTTDPAVFAKSVELLADFNVGSSKLISANFAVAIAVYLHRDVPGVAGDRLVGLPGAALTDTHTLQHAVCDKTWAKEQSFLPTGAEGEIFKPFTGSFKPSSNNNWRNSFDLQGGIGCDAPYDGAFLESETFLGEHRLDCLFRDEVSGNCSSPAGTGTASRTCFNPNKKTPPPGPNTLAISRPKVLTRGVTVDQTTGYWYVEPTVDVLADLLGTNRQRVPALAFAAALYGGSPSWTARSTEISVERLRGDLALDVERFYTIFDPDERNAFNSALLGGQSRTAQTLHTAPVPGTPRVLVPQSDDRNVVQNEEESEGELTQEGDEFEAGLVPDGSLLQPEPFKQRDPDSIFVAAAKETNQTQRARLLERASRGHQRTLNSLVNALGTGFMISEQLGGFDLLAERNNSKHLFEVKTWTVNNLSKQVRSGWAQLLEYRERNSSFGLDQHTYLYLVLNRQPPMDYWAWKWLVTAFGIVPCWIEDAALQTFEPYAERLQILDINED